MVVRLIGRLLRPVRADIDRTAWHDRAVAQAPETLTVTSDAFRDGGPMPRRCAGSGVGDNCSPQLRWTGVPAQTAELVLVIEDPDVPLRRPIVHGLFSGIGREISDLTEGALGLGAMDPSSGANSLGTRFHAGGFGRRGYAGPRPVPGHGPHRYVFQLFALDRATGLGADADVGDALAAMSGHVIARGMLTGTYERR